MIRHIVAHLAAGVALAAVSVSCAAEVFPVVRNEPIVIRILGGKDGQPLARLHLTLIAGYDRRDMNEQLFREEVLTDAHGQARLSNQLANLPWLQVWVEKKTLCQENPRITRFSVELIRRDGLSTPNHCGMATVEDKPGVFTVFVKGKGAAPAAHAIATPTPAPAVAPVSKSAPASVQPGGSPTVSMPCPAGPKKPRRARNACGREIFALPGLALYLH
jgi:hypothetical protein